MDDERDRIAFVEQRDGTLAAKAFASRTLKQYRRALMRGKDTRRSGYGTNYRRTLLQSCIAFRLYLRAR